MKRNVIMLVIVVCATAAGAWARHPKADSSVEEVKTIDVTASRFEFEPASISVAQGDRVRLRLRSADGTHAVAIKAFRVKAMIPKGGETVSIEFVADQPGTFDFTCAEYCGAGHRQMKGTLVVLPPRK